MSADRPPRSRAWALLLVSGVLEAVWATALGASEGFGRPGPTVLFGAALALSMLTLARAARTIPMGTAYAVWTGVGAVLTVGWAAATGEQGLSVPQTVFLAGIVACVAGLRLAERPLPEEGPSAPPAGPADGLAAPRRTAGPGAGR